jgi:hypothetical protein
MLVDDMVCMSYVESCTQTQVRSLGSHMNTCTHQGHGASHTPKHKNPIFTACMHIMPQNNSKFSMHLDVIAAGIRLLLEKPSAGSGSEGL